MSAGLPYVRLPRGRNLCGKELEDYVRELADSPELWIDLVRHDRNQRHYEEIFSDEYVTAWLICWMEDQDTGFHDHDISCGAVAVVSGSVREERLGLEGFFGGGVLNDGAYGQRAHGGGPHGEDACSDGTHNNRASSEETRTERLVRAGESFHFSASDIHRVRHAGSGPAVTLHVYSPPLLSMGAYVVDEDGRLRRQTVPSSEELRPLGVAA